LNLSKKGVNLRDKGVNLRDKGVNLSDFVENGIVFIMAMEERARRA